MMKSRLLIVVAALLFSTAIGAQPRAEYPRPQFERADWVNLNGEWSFALDLSDSGRDRDFYNSKGFEQRITVPFAPESKLSGIGYTDFINSVWYQRMIQIPSAWQGKRVKLNFGAVYYESVSRISWVTARSTASWCMPRATFAAARSPEASSRQITIRMVAATPVPPVSGRRCGWRPWMTWRWSVCRS